MNGNLKRIKNAAIYTRGYLDGIAMIRSICVEIAKAPEDRPYQNRELNCTAYLYLSLAGHD